MEGSFVTLELCSSDATYRSINHVRHCPVHTPPQLVASLLTYSHLHVHDPRVDLHGVSDLLRAYIEARYQTGRVADGDEVLEGGGYAPAALGYVRLGLQGDRVGGLVDFELVEVEDAEEAFVASGGKESAVGGELHGLDDVLVLRRRR